MNDLNDLNDLITEFMNNNAELVVNFDKSVDINILQLNTEYVLVSGELSTVSIVKIVKMEDEFYCYSDYFNIEKEVVVGIFNNYGFKFMEDGNIYTMIFHLENDVVLYSQSYDNYFYEFTRDYCVK